MSEKAEKSNEAAKSATETAKKVAAASNNDTVKSEPEKSDSSDDITIVNIDEIDSKYGTGKKKDSSGASDTNTPDTTSDKAPSTDSSADIPRHKIGKKKSKLKIFIIIIVLLAIGGVAAYFLLQNKPDEYISATVQSGEIYSKLEFVGDVAPRDTRSIFPLVNQVLIKEVRVDDGDYVNEGDVLVILDSSSVESEIRLKTLDKEQSEIDLESKITDAELTLSQLNSNISKGANTTLNPGMASLDSAINAYEKAYNTWYIANRDYEDDNTSAIVSAKNAVRLARIDHDNAPDDSAKTIALENAEAALAVTRQEAKEKVNELLVDVLQAQKLMEDAHSTQYATATSVNETKEKAQKTLKDAKNNNISEQKQVEIDKLTQSLDNYVVKAPCSGYISGMSIKVGDTTSSKEMMKILNYDSEIVNIDVDEIDLSSFSVGTIVSVYITSQDKSFDGRVSKIAPEATKKNDMSYIKVSVSFVPDEVVSSGLGATVSTLPPENASYLMVPIDAVYTDYETNEKYVYVSNVKDDPEPSELIQRTVVTGIDDSINIAILSGLEEGDVVFFKNPAAEESAE